MNETTEYEQLLADLAAVENLQKSIPPAADGEGNGDPDSKGKGKKPDGEGAVDPADKQVAAAAAADLPAETTAYTMRHSVITDLVADGLDLFTVAALAGTSVAMIERHYGHLQQERARDALAGLAL